MQTTMLQEVRRFSSADAECTSAHSIPALSKLAQTSIITQNKRRQHQRALDHRTQKSTDLFALSYSACVVVRNMYRWRETRRWPLVHSKIWRKSRLYENEFCPLLLTYILSIQLRRVYTALKSS